MGGKGEREEERWGGESMEGGKGGGEMGGGGESMERGKGGREVGGGRVWKGERGEERWGDEGRRMEVRGQKGERRVSYRILRWRGGGETWW